MKEAGGRKAPGSNASVPLSVVADRFVHGAQAAFRGFHDAPTRAVPAEFGSDDLCPGLPEGRFRPQECLDRRGLALV